MEAELSLNQSSAKCALRWGEWLSTKLPCHACMTIRRDRMTPTEEELESMLNELDADGSGDVDLGEFLAAMTEKLNDPEV